MKIKKIPFAQPVINAKKATSIIKKVFNDNFPNEGKFVNNFEEKISKLLKVKYVVSATSGTISIFLALKALGVKRNDEVIVPNITFPATANAVKLTGAKLVLADVNQEDLLINIDDLKKKITKKTKAIIPVHISGRGGKIKELIKFAKNKKIFIIEDAAEAFMSKLGKNYLGTLGDAGCFSFASNKIITTGQGGIIVTNNKKTYVKIKKLKDQGRQSPTIGGEDYYDSVGYNFKFTNMQGALGLSQLTDLSLRIKILKNHYFLYKKYLIKNKYFRLIGFNTSLGELPLWTDAYCSDRNKLFEYLRQKGANCRYFWLPLNVCKPYKQSFSRLNNSRKLYKKLIWLPSSLDIKKKDIIRVCKFINKYYLQKLNENKIKK